MTNINKLVDLVEDINFINNLSTIGVIAGGSIVYALNNYVPIDSVNDIDVFVNNEKDFNTILDLVQTNETQKYDIRWNNDESYYIFEHEHLYNSIHNDDIPTISIVSVTTKKSMVPFQIIFKQFSNPLELIKSFDLDYVQCAYHNGKLVQTQECIESHKNKQVNYFYDLRLKTHRLKKALSKGFQVYWLDANDTEKKMVKVTLEYIHNCKKTDLNTYLPQININEKPAEFLSFKDLEIIDWKITRTKKDFPPLITYYGEFILDCLGNQIRRETISCLVKFKMVNFYMKHNGDEDKDILVTIKKGYIPNYKSFKKFVVDNKINKDFKDLDLSKEYIINFYVYMYDNANLRSACTSIVGKITKILPHNELIKVVPFSKNYKKNTKKLFEYNHNSNIINDNSNKPYHKIKLLIKKHKNDDDTLSHAKMSAYKYFLYCINDQGKDEKYAIKQACTQMTIDANKISNNGLFGNGAGFFLNMIAQTQDTIDEMIHYIEGFN
jgi:hypothetical protein